MKEKTFNLGMSSLKIILKAVFGIMLFWSASSASVLGELAAALPEKTWVKMPSNQSLIGLSMGESLFYYNDGAVWDPIRKQVRWVASGGTCCTNGQYYMVTYREADNTWTKVSTPFKESGHGYDGNALDPKTGDNYFAFWSDKAIKKWNGLNWGALPAVPVSGGCCYGLSWFSKINNGNGGLVFVGGNNQVAVYNGTTWTKVSPPSVPWGGYELFAEYNPVHSIMWLGGRSVVNYTMDTQFKLTRQKDAPFRLKPNATLNSVDPVGGKYIVYSMEGDQTWWEFDHLADTWNRITDMKNEPDLGGCCLFQVPIADYGIIMVFEGKDKEVYLYRHSKSAGSAVDAGAHAYRAPGLKLYPNPFRSRIVFSYQSPVSSRQNLKIHIFNAAGKLIKKLKTNNLELAAGISWNAASTPPGVYIARLTVNRQTFERKIVLTE